MTAVLERLLLLVDAKRGSLHDVDERDVQQRGTQQRGGRDDDLDAADPREHLLGRLVRLDDPMTREPSKMIGT